MDTTTSSRGDAKTIIVKVAKKKGLWRIICRRYWIFVSSKEKVQGTCLMFVTYGSWIYYNKNSIDNGMYTRKYVQRVQEVGGGFSSRRQDGGTSDNGRLAISIVIISELFENTTKHATENDTDVKPSKWKNFRIFQEKYH